MSFSSLLLASCYFQSIKRKRIMEGDRERGRERGEGRCEVRREGGRGRERERERVRVYHYFLKAMSAVSTCICPSSI